MGHATAQASRLNAELQRAKLGRYARKPLATAIRIALARWWRA